MIDKIKQLRDETGASIGHIRAALQESGGDVEGARERLSKKFGALAQKKSEREVHSGVIDAYIHSNGHIGAMIELQCETDFVARNPEFKALAHEIAMQISAMAPKDVSELLGQEYIKDATKTIQDLVHEAVGKFGENIKVRSFARLEL